MVSPRIPSWTRSWWRTTRGWRKENASFFRFNHLMTLQLQHTPYRWPLEAHPPPCPANALAGQRLLTSHRECTTAAIPNPFPNTPTPTPKGTEIHTDRDAHSHTQHCKFNPATATRHFYDIWRKWSILVLRLCMNIWQLFFPLQLPVTSFFSAVFFFKT